jgi:signal transduction histidine kinase
VISLSPPHPVRRSMRERLHAVVAARAEPPTTRGLALVLAAGMVLCAVTALVTISGSPADPALAAAGRVFVVATPIGAGAYAVYRGESARFGTRLIVLGFLWFLSTLAGSSNAWVYSTGRVFGWIAELMLAYVILCFPSGRLPGRLDRAIVTGGVVLVATLYLPTALLARRYPVPDPFSSCVSGCPHNAFFAVSSQPAFLGGVVLPLRDLLLILLFGAVTLRLAWRWRRATRLMRLTLNPVIAVAIARLIAYIITVALRRVSPASALVEPMTWALALLVPVMALAFLVAAIRWRLFAAGALERLAAGLGTIGRPGELRAALAAAFDDPTLRLAYPDATEPGEWVTGEGRRTSLPEPDSDQGVILVSNGRPLAAIVHDAALRDEPQLKQAVAEYASMALENERLSSELKASLYEVRESRARIIAAADDERRRIERDLHDGAQQRLVALGIRLRIAEEAVGENPERDRERLHALGDELTKALEETRTLARGIYPQLLAERGLTEALQSAARQGPIDTVVVPSGIGRYSVEVESAIYFFCLEALQNALKHAAGATAVTIALTDRDCLLTAEVRDNGVGFDPKRTEPGAGLTNMKDRLGAVGGTLNVITPPGGGALVRARLTLPSASTQTDRRRTTADGAARVRSPA